MTIERDEELAKRATPGPWYSGELKWLQATERTGRIGVASRGDAAYLAAISPERLLRYIAAIKAADAMRGEGYEPRPGVAKVAAYDAARSALDEHG